MTREEIRAVVVGLEQAGEGEAVASRKLCRDAVTLLQWMADKGDSNPDDDVLRVLSDLDRERKAVSS